jgi:7-keto-8-aminopelargonate synthetase-like enzyme
MQALEKKYRQTAQKRVRTLFPLEEDKFINFSSKDFLNLSFHPFVKSKGVEFAKKWGAGHLSTRPLIAYENQLHLLEESFAKFLGHETVTFFEHSLPLTQKIITEIPNALCLDAVDKKNGTLLDFEEAKEFKEKSNTILVVDDSKTIGWLGNLGFGHAAEKKEVDVLIGSFHKRFGSYVSYVATTNEMKKRLFEKIPELHKEKFIPPLFLGMIDASIHLIPSMRQERKKLSHIKNLLSHTVFKALFQQIDPKAPFINFEAESIPSAKKLQHHLADYFFYIQLDQKLLTFYPNLFHTEKEITNLYLALSSFKELSLQNVF